jgi:hypothetical protein
MNKGAEAAQIHATLRFRLDIHAEEDFRTAKRHRPALTQMNKVVVGIHKTAYSSRRH